MKYAIELNELDAAETVAPREDAEEREDFEARVDAARGKSIIILTIMDCDVVRVLPQGETAPVHRVFSPYFLSDNEQARWSILSQTMKRAKNEIVERERGKPPTLTILS